MATELFEPGKKLIFEKVTGDRMRRIIYGASFYDTEGDERIEVYEKSSLFKGWLDGRSIPVDEYDKTEDGHIKFSMMDNDYVIRPMEDSDSVVEENGGVLFERSPDNDEEEEKE